MDDLDIFNDVAIQRTGGIVQRVGDTVSQGRYGIRTFSKSGLLQVNDTDCLDTANICCSATRRR